MPDPNLEVLTLALLDLACPPRGLFYSNRKDNPNTYIPGAQNTTWSIYTTKFVRGIPQAQVISVDTKGSDTSIVGHSHGFNNHRHAFNLIRRINALPVSQPIGANIQDHTHGFSHEHSGGSHGHSPIGESNRTGIGFLYIHDSAVKKEVRWLGSGSLDALTAQTGQLEKIKNSDPTVGEYTNASPTITSDITGDIGSIAVGHTQVGISGPADTEYSDSAGIENGNIPAYKEVYIWQRIT